MPTGMWMQGHGGRNSACASVLARFGVIDNYRVWFYVTAFLLLALAASGCTTTQTGQASLANASGTAVSFETIEGAPAQVVGRLMNDLNEEAAARQIAVLPRGGSAIYRIRGYLAFN